MTRRYVMLALLGVAACLILVAGLTARPSAASGLAQGIDPTVQWQTVQAQVDARFTQTAQAPRPTLDATAAFEATVDAAFADALAATLTAEAPAQPSDPNIHRDIFHEPVGEASSARIIIDIPLAEATITSLDPESEDLFSADVTYVGTIDYYAVGEDEKFISLTNPVHTLSLSGINADLPWVIGINPAVPLDLEINVGVGHNTFDFTGMDFGEVLIHTGVGETHVTLPVGVLSYLAEIDGGAGNLTVDIPDGAAIALNVTGGVGSTTLELGGAVAVRLEATWGVGSLDLPDHFEQISLHTNIVGGQGVWQTPGYDRAERRVVITYQGGVGNLTLEQTLLQ